MNASDTTALSCGEPCNVQRPSLQLFLSLPITGSVQCVVFKAQSKERSFLLARKQNVSWCSAANPPWYPAVPTQVGKATCNCCATRADRSWLTSDIMPLLNNSFKLNSLRTFKLPIQSQQALTGGSHPTLPLSPCFGAASKKFVLMGIFLSILIDLS